MSNAIQIADKEFETEVVKADRPVLIYFWASWCGPCRLMSPAIDWVAENYSDRLKVVKMEVDPNPATVKLYKVEGVPALRLIRSTEVIAASEGALSKQKITDMLDTYLQQ
ncbi:thiol reductase thioredoxin [Chroococcidiopsis sp. CCALA 051]|nr:thioredoxin domain-containing protein [Chroococcidiopsis sp. CCALA 051]MBE9018713.1 thioredoxin [Chroococcidiopsidales cyanobacterium LEGE 13417]PSM46536.1 thiol reductase thioredoxin [Chroococcidiopsis sp. CCALA 051]